MKALRPGFAALLPAIAVATLAIAPSRAWPESGSAAPSVIVRAERAVERGAHAAARGIEHGVQAGAKGVQRGATAAGHGIEHGLDAGAHGIQRGANAAGRGVEHGAKATAGAANRVSGKVAGSPSSAQASAR